MTTVLITLAVLFCGAILWPTRKPPPAMASISEPFAEVDFTTMPELSFHPARDGQKIAYRHYPSKNPKAVALLLHGSSSNSASMHPLSQHLSQNAVTAFTIDIRGHGETGNRGDVDHINQPSEYIEDMLSTISHRCPDLPVSLAGFSSGAGLALISTGLGYAKNLRHLILLAPMLGVDQAPFKTPNPNSSDDRWAYPNIFRIIGLSILNSLGVRFFNHLKVLSFAIGDEESLTGSYSYRLMVSVDPGNAEKLLENTKAPITLIAGEKDEVFTASAYADAVLPIRPDAQIEIIPALNHIEMTLHPTAHKAITTVLLESDSY